MQKYEKPPTLRKVSSPDEIEKCLNENRLVSLSLRIPCQCNLQCRYCKGNLQNRGISFGQIKDVIRQAVDLGAENISIVGEGEPLLYKDGKEDIFSLIDYINPLGALATVFTNNTLVTAEIAAKLFKRNTVIVAKQNSLKPDVQDYFSGKGAWKKISAGLENLKKAGFASTNPSRLAIHTVICNQNIEEIPAMWRMWRKQNIIPYVQAFVPPVKRNSEFRKELYVKPEQAKRLFQKLLEIDQKEFGFTWDVNETYPIAALGCTIVKNSLGISATGNAHICAFVEEPLGNIKEKTLKEILEQPYVKKIRNTNYNPKGKNKYFFGCRALTFNMTGDRFAEDPFYKEFKKN